MNIFMIIAMVLFALLALSGAVREGAIGWPFDRVLLGGGLFFLTLGLAGGHF